MKKSLERIIKDDISVFRYRTRHTDSKTDIQTLQQLKDNYYILEHCSEQALNDLRRIRRKIKDSETVPGLFEKCCLLCKNGVLPDEKAVVDFFSGNRELNGHELDILPLVITCALINSAADAVRSKKRSSSEQLANAIISLRRMSETNFEYITENLFKAEEILKNDEIYCSMDEYSKFVYRKRIAFTALKEKKSEIKIAETAAQKAKAKSEHIGKYLFFNKKRKNAGFVFLIMEIIMPLAAAFCVSVLLKSVVAGVVLFFPLWEIFRHPIEAISLKSVHPKRFLRLSCEDERVINTHTLITVSTLIPSSERIKELEEHLEKLFLGNCMGNMKICCLADFKAAGMPRKPEDKIAVKSAKEAVDRLNKRYGGGFVLAVRPRVHSKTQNEFIGRERKRGAITELIRAIKDSDKGFCVLHGDISEIKKTKYIITLDTDTGLAFDSARELVAIAEHPLNRPVIKNGRVISGYGILAPKAEIRLCAEKTTLFGSFMAGDSGITAYDSLSSERYQDLFGEGTFCGKGLIDVDAYYELLDKGLPKETILSHDIIESGYLRAGYVPDVCITEEFPQNVLSYYQRLHRWVRGDWQNLKFIFEKNPLGFISRYKMFDNLRRSITPVLCIAAIILSLFTDDRISAFIAVCSAFALCARNFYSAVALLMNGGFFVVSRLSFSKAVPSALAAFIRAFASLAFSAREAFICADAICKSLWRMFISKKNLLEWVTAAQSEHHRDLKSILISCVPSVATALLLLVFGMPVHRMIGIIILADIPFVLFTSSPIKQKKNKVSSKQRESVVSYAAAMWGFFENHCGKENNFLPPDNIQFSPVRAMANRTSPTNIGLMFASFLSARDMGFITTAELYMRLNLSLLSVEKLEKYEGNLLNWYSTSTLQPLNPRFISTVDSGNFLCCLTAVKEGLREYVSDCPQLNGIIERIEKIISETNLKILFNGRKNLFHIGIDPDTVKKSNSYYDLYMSEARMTSYFAVARREVSKKHWGAQGRIFVRKGRFTGLASWTGTMFEYFMPNLFLPSPAGSLTDEALRFCIYCQKKRAGRLPFGISESGFYSFDRDLNYQYKAHGIQKLALKRNMNAETVISPYSSFLTLSYAPNLSLRNLQRLEKMGMNGIYGFYEAIDFTKGRNSGEFSVVRSYMAHHVGMSMVAANNFLNKRCMQKRFMNDRLMKGAESLLEEKNQTDSQIFKNIKANEIPNIRERVYGKTGIHENPSHFSPEAMLLSNGRMTTCITDVGTGVSLFDGIDVTVNSSDLFIRPQGVFGVFKTERGILSFTKALDTGNPMRYKAEFFKEKAVHTAQNSEVSLKMKTTLLKQHNCELRKFTVENLSGKNHLKGKIIVYFEPCLEKRDAFASHPMFSKLFLRDEWDEDSKCVLFSRRSSASKSDYGIAAGLVENADVFHETSRERALISPHGIFSLGINEKFNGRRGNPDCCCAFMVETDIEPRKKVSYTLAVVVGESKEQALDSLLTVRAGKASKRTAQNVFFGQSVENSFAAKILPCSLFPKTSRGRMISDEKCIYDRSKLWSFGISGDLPLITVKIENEDDIPSLLPYIRINKRLRSCGIKTDLAVIFEEEDKYSLPITSSIKSALEKEDCGLMMGVRGGVHLVNESLHSYEQMSALKNTAEINVKAGENWIFKPEKSFKPLKLVLNNADKKNGKNLNIVKRYTFTNNEISIDKSSKSLDIPWCMVFANQSFGTMVSDKALGFTWSINSRENKLTPWLNDLISDNRGELLILKINGVLYDLVSIADAKFTPQNAVWKAEVCGLEFSAEVSVAKKGMVKKCSVEILNNSDSVKSFDLMYYTLPVLGTSRDNAGVFYASKTEHGITLQNSFSEIAGFSYLSCSEKADYFCSCVKAFFEGHFESFNEHVTEACCVAVGKRIKVEKGRKIALEFYLSWGSSEKAAIAMPLVADYGEKNLNPAEIRGENKSLCTFFNSFLYSQVKQSRFYGKTGFYQCSGAYGFRDQLQDCLAFADFEPKLMLRHILRCSAVQFEEGDVLHWWHVLVNKRQIIKGIRTRCSDDMLWLAYACMIYYQKTGDSSFWSLETPYIKGETLRDGENERYFSPERTDYSESLLSHCIKAVDKSLNFGKNGLPLIGSCDWNDGFSRIGESGAESVWLAMFQIMILKGMSNVCSEHGMKEKSDFYRLTADKLRLTVEEKAWLGDRYARIVLENGKPFYEERDFIDILPQAFAVFAGIGKDGRADKALTTALDKLYDGKTVRLLSPPFDEEDRETVGYIASYPPGIRENGGQYTHAAVWLAMALLESGRNEEAISLINSINPMSRYSDEKSAAQYRAEPYVLAGDVSFGGEIDSRAGWTHFTGSAAWFYRCIFENAEALGCKILKPIVKHENFTRSEKHQQISDLSSKSKNNRKKK
ncbi:MAG: hypothetical protein IJE74_05835 [Clostridia bacterium]|nr:hypothetical protein [Clostridia bacterium]